MNLYSSFRLIAVPPIEGDQKYIAYTTNERVIGLTKLPLDGNPNKSIGLIAHPGVVSRFYTFLDLMIEKFSYRFLILQFLMMEIIYSPVEEVIVQ